MCPQNMFEKWPWWEKSSTPAIVISNQSSTRFKKGSGNEEGKFIACYTPSAREGQWNLLGAYSVFTMLFLLCTAGAYR